MAFFSSGAGYVAAGMLGSAVLGAVSSNNAANTQADAANNAANLQASTTQQQLAQQKDMYNQNVQRMQPYVEAGAGSLATLKSGLAPGGQFTKTFNQNGDFTQDPSYKWRLDQGLKALQGSAAAKGTLMTGQGLADINNYAQGAASTEYQNAYNRFQDTNNTLFNRLNSLAGNSQNAAGGLGAQGTQVSSNLANTAMSGVNAQNTYLTGGAAASAAGQIGMANAVNAGVGQGINFYQNQNLLNQLSGNQGLGQYSNQWNVGANAGPQLPLDISPM
jgi:hypothetical protein